MPEPSERLVVWELPVEIESADERQIGSAIVTPPAVEEEPRARMEAATA